MSPLNTDLMTVQPNVEQCTVNLCVDGDTWQSLLHVMPLFGPTTHEGDFGLSP